MTRILEHLQKVVERGRQVGWESTSLVVERTVLAHGREYIGIDRPKGYRHQRAHKMCFKNATDVAYRGRGTYVEGLAMSEKTGFTVHHAWVTIDGQHAIDPTLPDAPAHHYFGIPFSEEIISRVMCERGFYGVLDLLWEKPESASLLELGEID